MSFVAAAARIPFCIILLVFFLFRRALALTPPRPFWFSPSTLPAQTKGTTNEVVVFLHGRLEAEPGEVAFPPPAELYNDFCTALADALDAPVLMVDYHDTLASKLSQEPRTWTWGPICQQIASVVTREIGSSNKCANCCGIVLVTFSMGAAMGLKLLAGGLSAMQINKTILIEPVWRCWLSLAPRNVPISQVPTLAVWGTLDKDTLTDSGRNVSAALRPLLPNLQTHTLEGANHWYILNADIIASAELLQPNRPTQAPVALQKELATIVGSFVSGLSLTTTTVERG